MDYGYSNARIRAMKSLLLKPDDFETLIHKADIDAVIAEMEETPYRHQLEKASIQYAGIARIEVAVRKDMVAAFRKILNFMKDTDAEKYLKIILRRWDIHNIKTILRGKKIAASPEEIFDCLIPAGELDEAALIELTKQPDVKAVIDLLATWGIEYSKPLTRKFKQYSENKDMAVLEYAIDKFFFENALSVVRRGKREDDRIIREFIFLELDLTNIKTALKVLRDKLDIGECEKFFIEGSPVLDLKKYLSLLKTGAIEGAIKELKDTPYHFLSSVPEKFVAAGKISEFEKELDKFLIKKGIGHFLKDPLSIAIPLAYTWAKINESINIRVIARGKSAFAPEHEIREVLIYV